MISAKRIITFAMICLLIAILGFVLALFGFRTGRYAVYLAVPIGALTTIVGASATIFGKVKNDIQDDDSD
jgi:hypothetical protein